MTIVFASAAFTFFFISLEKGVGQVPAMVLFVLCVLLALAFGRRTAADKERIAREKERTAAWAEVFAGAKGDPEPKREGDPLKRLLIGAIVLQVLAFPFMVVWDLMKNQK